MARAATSRNLFGFGKSKAKPRRVSKAKRAERSQERVTVSRLIDSAYAEGRRLGRPYGGGSKMRPSDTEIAQQFSDWIGGQNVSERIRSLKATPRNYKNDPVLRHVFGSFAHGYMDSAKENPGCARTLKGKVSDRAKRYRANQPGCRPSGLKKCKLCGSRSDVMVDHVDGNESNGRKSNLRWLCRSCNNTLGAEMARTGAGRRTVQYNPKHKGAQTLGEYMQAVLQHTRGSHDAAGKIIHETPKWRRKEFASEIWARRESHGTARPGSSSAGYDEPDWVTNPAKSATQYRLAQAVLSGTARQTRMSRKVAQEIIDRTPARLRSEYSRSNPSAYAVYRTKPYRQYLGTFATKAEAIRFSSKFSPGENHEIKTVGRAANNPESTTEYRLGYNLGQMDLQNATLAKTHQELEATFLAQFPESIDGWERFEHGYRAGYGGELGGAAPNPGSPKLRALLKRMSLDQQADLTRAIDRFYYAAIEEGFKPSEAQSFAEKRAVPEAEKILKRGNPEPDSEEYEQARKIAELFHGHPVKEEIKITEQIREHDWLWRIGPLVKLKIRTLTKRNATLPFHQTEEGMVHLFCSPDGRQFYLRGGDQELDLKALGMGEGTEWYRDHMLIGEAKEITYRDKKKFHKFKITDYFHKLGEVTKKKPALAYDTLSHKMSILGGQYKVETDELVDGMSPGIVN